MSGTAFAGAVDAFFVDGPAGRLFALHLSPPPGVLQRTPVLYCPPFCEEMNKSRRMAALFARRAAAFGHPVLLVDLWGTGDSEGDLADVTWELWRQDVRAACAELLRRSPGSRVVAWGLRTGAMLALDLAGNSRLVESILLWQPVLRGRQFVNQFMRLRVTAERMSGSESVTTDSLRAHLREAGSLEVGGYTLSSSLVDEMDQLDLTTGSSSWPIIRWVEISGARTLSPGSTAIIRHWLAAGTKVDSAAVTGDLFWSSVETCVAPELTETSMVMLDGG